MVAGMVEILLVEDNLDDVKLALSALKPRTILNPIRVARDGAEALATVFGSDRPNGAPAAQPPASRPDVVLLELPPPKVDGIEVLRRLRSDPRTRTLPVAALITSANDRDRIERSALGIASYIDKPVDLDQFVTATAALGLYWAVVNRPPALGERRAC